MKKETIEALQQFAISKGGRLLSTAYINCKEKAEWGCREGHRWPAAWDNIKRGRWCPHCVNLNKPAISELQQYAAIKNGKLISTEYVNCEEKLEWECEKGHRWNTTWGSIKSNHVWCLKCHLLTIRTDISVLQQHARLKNGQLISTVYNNSYEKLEWECKEGHKWKAKWNSILDGHWCPTCSKQSKPDILILQRHAFSKGGKLISKIYVNCNDLLEWECKEGHKWETMWRSVKFKNTWCPECARYKTEKLCKEILEKELKIELKKRKFKYNNNQYEFDGYNEKNKIAFEYNGYQHYKYPNYWHKTKEIFEAAQQRDRLKEEYCILNGIKLIVIPYTEEKNLEEYIKCQIKKYQEL